jgi:hypothetical protein
MISVPKIQKVQIQQFIVECEQSKDPIENIIDIKNYIGIHM